MAFAIKICCSLLMHLVAIPLCFACDRAGSSIAARMAMIAMTTSSSIRVNASARQNGFTELFRWYDFGVDIGRL